MSRKKYLIGNIMNFWEHYYKKNKANREGKIKIKVRWKVKGKGKVYENDK